MKIYMNRFFSQWAKSLKITEKALKNAVIEIENGLYESNLGSSLFKKRMTAPGRGKSSGYRTLIAFKSEKLTFFIYGYSKNERDNINDKELIVYRKLAKDLLKLNTKQIEKLVALHKLIEVTK